MMVPLTSDLGGYILFWNRMIWRLVLALVGVSVPIIWLLWQIWRK